MTNRPVSTQPQYNFRRTFLRWHRYAALWLSPILAIVATTGAVLVFPDAIDRQLRPDLFCPPATSDSTRDVLPTDAELLANVHLAYPASRVFSYVQSSSTSKSYRYWLVGDYQGFLEVFVAPSTGAILGDRLREKSFVRITEQLHRRILTGKWGSILVDLTTAWTIVILLTGIFLWWPRNLKALIRNVTVNWNLNLRKFNWRLHSALGFYTFVVLLPLAVTGMVVSEVTGTMYRATMFAAGAFPPALISPPLSEISTDQPAITLDAAIRSARSVVSNDLPLEIRLPLTSNASYLISTKIDGSNLAGYQAVIVDQYSGNLIDEMAWADSHPLMKIRSYSLAIHFGSIGGMPTKILAFIASLLTPIVIITGYLIWWWNRPTKIRDSQRNANIPMPWWLRMVVGMFCLVFPTVGITVAGIVSCALVRRCIGALRKRQASETSI